MNGGQKKPKKATFANAVIAVCVTVALLVTLSVVLEYHRLGTVMPSGVISALFAFWGGELLIVALRQIFGSDVMARAKPPDTSAEESKKSDDTSDIFGGSI